jgi:hypothetical protein
MGIIEESEDDGLFGVVVAEFLLVDLEVLVVTVFARLNLTYIQQNLLLVLYLVEFPACLPLSQQKT